MQLGLVACTTTVDTAKNTAASASDAPAQIADSHRRAQLRFQLGANYFQAEQFPTALKELNSAIAIDSTYADAYGVRALVYMQLNEPNLAEQDFLQVLRLSPNNPDHTNNYAWFLCQNGKPKQALELVDKVLKDRAYTQPLKALNVAGTCSIKMKDYAAAENYFIQAVRLDPNNQVANTNLAKITYQKHDWSRSQFYSNRVLKNEIYTPELLWLGIKASHKLQDSTTESSLGVQLRRRFPDSDELALYQRGAFDE